MNDMEIYPEGTEIVVIKGKHKGHSGTIISYESIFDNYFVHLPEVNLGAAIAIEPYQIDRLDRGPTEHPEEPEEATPPEFGMSEEEFVSHLEFLIGRSLSRIPTTGPAEAFFGYQEFEGMTAEEVLLRLLDKIEEGIAHLAQAHILITRIGVSYRTIIKEITGDDTEGE